MRQALVRVLGIEQETRRTLFLSSQNLHSSVGERQQIRSAREKGDGKQSRVSRHLDVRGVGISDRVISEVICKQRPKG